MIPSLFSRTITVIGICTPLALTACGFQLGANSLGPCPKIGALQDVAQMPVQRAGANSNVEAVATIAASAEKCTYDKSASAPRPWKVSFDLKVTARAARSGNSSLRSVKAPYFVAIFGPENKLLNTKTGTFDLSLSGGGQTKSETYTITLPIPPGTESAVGYRVTTGFRLTQQQLATNRQLLGF